METVYLDKVAQIVGRPVLLKLDKTEHSMYYGVYTKEDNTLISEFVLRPMPGCHGICISHAVKVAENFRGKGIGSILAELRVELCRTFRYSMIHSTVVMDNVPQIKIMNKLGFKLLFEFTNLKSGRKVGFFAKELT